MTRLDAALMAEQDARRALDTKLATLAKLIHECQRAVLLGEPLPVRWVTSKAQAVEDASTIWDATRGGVENVRANRRAA